MSKKITVLILAMFFNLNSIKIQQGTPAGSSATPFVSSFGDMLTAKKTDSFNMMFQYNVPTDLVTSRTSGTGAITSTLPFAVLTSSTNGSGSAQLESKQRLRYLPAHEGYACFSSTFTTGIIDSTQYIGLIDDNDGWAIGYNGTAFSIFWKRGGNNVDGFPLGQTNFNLDQLNGTGPSKMTLDPTKLNIYRISFGWLGVAPITFEVLREDGVWFPFHMIRYPNTESTTSTNSSMLPMRAYTSATNAKGNVTLKTPNWCCGTVGKSKVQQRSFQYYPGDITTAGNAGNGKYLFSLRNNSNFPIGSKNVNKINSTLHYFAASNKSNTWATFRLIKNGTLTGTKFSNTDSINSCIQKDISGKYVSGGTEVFVVPLAQKGQEILFLDSNEIDIVLYPGETLSVVADVSGRSTVNVSIYWKELV